MTFYSIQYLRGIASVFVLTQHAIHKSESKYGIGSNAFSIGESGVDLFFIISGFIIAYTSNKHFDLGKFIYSRITRIIPMYWLVTSAALLALAVIPEAVNSSGGKPAILESYLLLPSADSYLIKNGWTLSYEMYFYFIFALTLLTTNDNSYNTTLFSILLLSALGLAIQGNLYFEYATNYILLEFVFGIIIFKYYEKIPKSACYALISTGITALLIVNIMQIELKRTIAYGVPWSILVMGLVSLDSKSNWKASNKFTYALKLLGDSSYSLYLVHPFTLVASFYACSFFLSSTYFNQITLISIAISLIVGHLSFEYVEKPILARLKRTP